MWLVLTCPSWPSCLSTHGYTDCSSRSVLHRIVIWSASSAKFVLVSSFLVSVFDGTASDFGYPEIKRYFMSDQEGTGH